MWQEGSDAITFKDYTVKMQFFIFFIWGALQSLKELQLELVFLFLSCFDRLSSGIDFLFHLFFFMCFVDALSEMSD